MTGSLSNRLIVSLAVTAAVLWTLMLALVYGLMSATDDVWRWMSALVSIPQELAHTLTAAGAWLGQFGVWLLGVLWALGLAVVAVLALSARHLVRLIPKFHREGELS